jgi:hypothetical protein
MVDGRTIERLNISTNDPENGHIALGARAKTLTAFRFDPEPHFPCTFLLDRVPRTAGAQSKTITIVRGDGGPLEPSVDKIVVPGVTAELCEIEPHERYELTLTIQPPWPDDNQYSTEVTLSTGVGEQPKQTIKVIVPIERTSSTSRPAEAGHMDPTQTVTHLAALEPAASPSRARVANAMMSFWIPNPDVSKTYA